MDQKLDPKLLYYLHIVCEYGSLLAASSALGVSQPTLSRKLNELEAMTGEVLTIRGRHGISATEIGAMLARQGKHIAADIQQSQAILQQFKQSGPKTINCGFGPIMAAAMLPKLISEKMMKTGDENFVITVSTARQLLDDVRYGKVDFAVIATPLHLPEDGVRSLPITTDQFGVFAGRHSPLRHHKGAPSKEALANANWVAIDAAVGPESSHQRLISKLGIEARAPLIQFQADFQGLFQCLLHSDALAFLPLKTMSVVAGKDDITPLDIDVPLDKRQVALWCGQDAHRRPDLWAIIQSFKAEMDSIFTKP
ncbi:MAG: LysR family transcriptional regulator [Candidatus Puniceispirillaceae bacterium]